MVYISFWFMLIVINILGRSIHALKGNTETLVVA